MDLKSLRCFLLLAEELHFGRAAERTHLTQSGLSQRIARLEDAIGTPLLLRDRHSVKLSAAGEAFLPSARRATQALGDAREQALRAAQGSVGLLRLAMTVVVVHGSLPSTIRSFRSTYPDVRLELAEINTIPQEEALVEGRIDLGILHPPVAALGLDSFEMEPEPLWLALPRQHPLASLTRVPLKRLAGQPLLIAPRRVGHYMYDELIAACHGAGFAPHLAQEAYPMTTLISLVEAGVGIGFVARAIASARRRGVVYRPVSGFKYQLRVAACWRENSLTPTAQRFLELLAANSRASKQHK
jgi:DNA-binding transcriptional LysR family regulator